MKSMLLICTVLFWSNFSFVRCRGVNGGMSCAVCTVVMGVAMQVAEINEENIVNATTRLCYYLPEFARTECLETVDKIREIVDSLGPEITPDVFCFLYGTCQVDVGEPLCHLFPLPFAEKEILIFVKQLMESRGSPGTDDLKIDVCNLPVIDDICKILNNSYISLNAAEDFDGDGFSAISPARGADWKGRDCRDDNENAYPGRQPVYLDIHDDSNCNGIFGVNNKTGISWEEELCSKSEPRGLIFIGDSISAHFHMPQIWMNPIEFRWPSLNASDVILDEIDWPQYGYATGFKSIQPNILIKGPTDSIYQRLRRRNRCNHRDYQNLSQNGASSYEGVEHVKAVNRNQSTDYPAIVFYAMQGNDVCNNFKNTLNYTTPVDIFRSNVLKVLHILNEMLPKKSHVILMGLVNADFIYDAMAERIHPLGYIHKNVRYKDVYKWLNCMQIGPCTGWLNSDGILRKRTSMKANELNGALKDMARTEKFAHFDLYYLPSPINTAVATRNISIPEFLESVDSLHPNQRAQPILTDIIWKFMEQELPANVLGPINKKNKLIKTLFGNQGGH